MSQLSFDHVALTVRDMDRSVAFYTDMLGCEPLGQLVLEDGGFTIVYLSAGDARIELFAHAGGDGREPDRSRTDRDPGFRHLAFRVDDVDGVAARLTEAGIRFTIAPRDAAGGVRLAFFEDPDGNLVEIVDGTPALDRYEPSWTRA